MSIVGAIMTKVRSFQFFGTTMQKVSGFIILPKLSKMNFLERDVGQ